MPCPIMLPGKPQLDSWHLLFAIYATEFNGVVMKWIARVKYPRTWWSGAGVGVGMLRGWGNYLAA